MAVMRLVESVDDTITCQKTILAELLKPLKVKATLPADALYIVTGNLILFVIRNFGDGCFVAWFNRI